MIATKKLSLILILMTAMGVMAGCATSSGSGGADQALMDDLLTERKIYNAIQNSSSLNSPSIFVGCIDGVVTLSGQVESAAEKAIAERVALSVGGVKSVNNNLSTP